MYFMEFAKLESARRWIWQLSFLLLFLRGSIYHSSGKAIICHCILSANRGNRCCRKVSKLGCAIPRDNSRVAWRIERSPSVVVSSIDRETITSTFHARIITISEQKGSPRGSRPE
ncbi:unnamed protein product [Xylocopa violacea]|uniref:Secreted protein n=1 Tax=Xylocopa violacea TaxID=135666 RepID=A0ABP1PDK1_XYLVO